MERKEQEFLGLAVFGRGGELVIHLFSCLALCINMMSQHNSTRAYSRLLRAVIIICMINSEAVLYLA